LTITGLLVAGTSSPKTLSTDTNGSNMIEVPAPPTNFKKSRRDIFLRFESLTKEGILHTAALIY